MTTKVTVLVGSLRAESVNRKFAEALSDLAPEGVELTIAENLELIPFYNEDLDGENAPVAATALREQVAGADRVLVVTPEYNATTPAVINNAIDWLSARTAPAPSSESRSVSSASPRPRTAASGPMQTRGARQESPAPTSLRTSSCRSPHSRSTY